MAPLSSGSTFGLELIDEIDGGEDGLKKEPRLRALESVVRLYCANHPDSEIDTAKTAVLDAIKEAAPWSDFGLRRSSLK